MSRPFFYAPEVWTGIEYQVASHMIMRGLVDEGLTIVKAVRDRYDGFRRNPWNEYECGNYYARALASYAVFIAMSGFRYSAVTQTMHLDPRLPDKEMVSFFSTNAAWGQFTLSRGRGKAVLTINVAEGELPIRALSLPFLTRKKMKASVEDGSAEASVTVTDSGAHVAFDKPILIRAGRPVKIRFD